MAAGNTIGDKLPMFMIGKAMNPQCFKNVKFLTFRYRNQQKVERVEIVWRGMQGMQMLVWASDALSTQTIVNCFRKSRISTESQETVIAEDDDPFWVLQDEIDDLHSVQRNLIEEDFDATAFTDIDTEVTGVQPPPSDAEIVAELLETEDVSDDDENYSGEVADEPVKCPDKNELSQVIETLQMFSYVATRGTQSNLTLMA